jgi:hypothetical protein
VADSGLDAHAIQRAGEAAVFGGPTSDGLPQSPVLRLRGEHLAAVLSDQHTHLLSRDDVSIFSQVTLSGVPQPPVTVDGHSESSLSSDEVMAGGQAEYHRPLGSHWQLDAFGQALTSVRKEEDGFQVSTNGTASTLISDRLVARAGWIQQRSTSRDVSSDVILDDSWRWRFFVSASYYLEDHLEVQGAISDDQLHQRIPLIVFGSPLPSTVYQRNQQFSLALTYRFMGSFAAPGLMAAENLAGPR